MKELLKVLKVGTARSDFPTYCKYINFQENYVLTCNGSEFVEVDNKFPFLGAVNLYVLENILKNCSTAQINQKDSMLVIEDGDFKSSLLIDDIEFPEPPEVNAEFVEVSDELLSTLKTAIDYTGEGILSYVFLHGNKVMATDKHRCFLHKGELDVKSPLGINRKILSVLSSGCRVGVYNNNTVVAFDGGRIIFQTALLDNYPEEKIISVVESTKTNIQMVCNVAVLQDAVTKVTPILFEEISDFVLLKNKLNKLVVSAESAVSGVATMVIDSQIEDKFKLAMNHKFISGIDFDFDVFFDWENSNRLYLTNGNAEIVLMGGD